MILSEVRQFDNGICIISKASFYTCCCLHSTNSADVDVTIAGSDCPISTISDSEIVCVTEAHAGSVEAQVEVAIQDTGIAYQVSDTGIAYQVTDTGIACQVSDHLPRCGFIPSLPPAYHRSRIP